MIENKSPVCGLCGATLPECGSFVQCGIFPTGYACTSCCVGCLHFFWAGSLPKCQAALSREKEKKTARECSLSKDYEKETILL